MYRILSIQHILGNAAFRPSSHELLLKNALVLRVRCAFLAKVRATLTENRRFWYIQQNVVNSN
jgi:hypothetical protein